MHGHPQRRFQPAETQRVLGLCLACAFLLVPGSPAVLATGHSRASRPNILLILADDLGYGDLGCYGQRLIRTPNLDRLAGQGVRFTQCYAGSTVCAPSRCALMTGLHTGHARVRGNALVPLKPDDLTVAEILKKAGYHTALIGKWGLGEAGTTGVPTKKGFDEFFGYLNQRHAHNYYPSFLWRNEEKEKLGNVVPNEDAEGAGVSTNRIEYSGDRFVSEALGFLERNRQGPFFLELAFTLPHVNNEAKRKGMEVPSIEPYGNRNWPSIERNKAAMITRLDHDVGLVLAKLRALGLEANTVVFFTSDNGPHKEGGVDPDFFHSSGPLRGTKRDLYEGGIRVPMMVRWPGHVAPGRVSDQVWAFWDFLPTAAEIVHAQPPANLDGISMLPAILGQKQTNHAFLYWEFHERGPTQAVRMGDWKAVRLGPDKPLRLYDLKTDVGEQTNIAAAHAEVVEQIESYLKVARTESPLWPLKAK